MFALPFSITLAERALSRSPEMAPPTISLRATPQFILLAAARNENEVNARVQRAFIEELTGNKTEE